MSVGGTPHLIESERDVLTMTETALREEAIALQVTH
jgi:hypothetical protein